MDVLASDTESFRMRDFDPDDSLSVARSDDTTRSDPDQMLQRLDLNDFDGHNQRGHGGAAASRIFHPSIRNVAVEQWAEFGRSNSDPRDKRRDSDASGNSLSRHHHESILKKPLLNSSSVLVNNTSSLIETACVVSLDDTITTTTDGGSVDNFSVSTTDISTLSTSVRLSTTSIASSASSQDGSAASVEALPPPAKSRSNSSVSVATSVGGGSIQEELKVNSMAATGAIPKSISFDKTADKDDGIINKRDRNNFFKNFKLPKIGRNRGGGRGSKTAEDFRISERLSHDTFNIPEQAEVHSQGDVPDGARASVVHENTDDILAKYRKQPPGSSSAPLEGGKGGADKSDEVLVSIMKPDGDEPDGAGGLDESELTNLEPSVIFDDAKRKLRLMLSEVSLLNTNIFTLYKHLNNLIKVDYTHALIFVLFATLAFLSIIYKK